MENNSTEVVPNVETNEYGWVKNVEVQPINDFEKDMTKNSYTPETLIEEESKETIEKPTELDKRSIINMVKVVSMHNLGHFPMADSSRFSRIQKDKLIKEMESNLELYKEDSSLFRQMFNKVCAENIFTDNVDYTKFPIYK